MKTIFYLEDDDALAYVTARALKNRAYHVDHVATLEEAESKLTQSVQSPYNYALLDLKIGHATSLQLVPLIKKHHACPIVILTGYGSIRTAVHAMKLGAINFLSKPCRVDEILMALDDSITDAVLEDPALDSVSIETVAPQSLKVQEWEAIQRALADNNNNISAAARQLKMHRRTLQRKLQKRHYA